MASSTKCENSRQRNADSARTPVSASSLPAADPAEVERPDGAQDDRDHYGGKERGQHAAWSGLGRSAAMIRVGRDRG
jgi:hypothetical protein